MAQVIIRNLDEDVVTALKRRAEREHKSLEQTLREILSNAAKPTADELIALSRRIRAMSPPTGVDSTDLIREDRDSR